MKPDKIKIACISDSPKPNITTGFANVARPILQGFHEAGFEVFSFGTMDVEPDVHKTLPYSFWAANPFDESGHRTVALFLVNVQPDVIFVLFDPGNTIAFLRIIIALQESGNIKKCPVVTYTPIEGVPIPGSTAQLFAKVYEMGGKAVVYSQKMVELVQRQFPIFEDLEWAHHGLDHAPFRKYNKEYRDHLRELAGWSDKFVVGSVGVNKRTKGFDTIIYTARYLRDIKQDTNIKFYLHTSPDQPTMFGYHLKDVATNYGVEDMLIFKPEVEEEAGGNVKGIDRHTSNLYIPQESIDEEHQKALGSMGFIDRLNMLDCYLDLSQVEGWGLPAHEAMRCGIPTISVKDRSIREEIYDGGVMFIEPEPFRTWTTWHTGSKLVLIDPAIAAQYIIELRDANPTIRKFWEDCALDNSSKYNWKTTQDKFVSIVEGVVDEYEYK